MNDLDFLNQMASTAEVAEGGQFIKHPCGTFAGVIEKVDQKNVEQRPVWELFIKTAYGSASHSRWGFSPNDMAEGRRSQEARDRMVGNISRIKRLFVDCGVWDSEQAKAMTWNEILGAWQHLLGKKCQLVVKPNQKKQGYTVTFINSPSDDPDIVDPIQVSPAPQGASNGQFKGNAAGVSNRKPPGSDVDDMGIPF